MFFRSTFVEPRRGDYQSPVALPSNSTNHRYYGTNLLLCSTAWGVTFLLRQERNQSPPKKGDLGEALRLCCGNTSAFRRYPRQPKFALPQDPLPRCANMLHDTNRFLNCSRNIYLSVAPWVAPLQSLSRCNPQTDETLSIPAAAMQNGLPFGSPLFYVFSSRSSRAASQKQLSVYAPSRRASTLSMSFSISLE